jgi:hypothetical protein
MLGLICWGGKWGNYEFTEYYFTGNGISLTLNDMELGDDVWSVLNSTEDENWGNGGCYYAGTYYYYGYYGTNRNPTGFMWRLHSQLEKIVRSSVTDNLGSKKIVYNTSNAYNFSPVVWAMGNGSVYSVSSGWANWDARGNYYGIFNVTVRYSDIFKEPMDIPGLEFPGGVPYLYDQVWNATIYTSGTIRE